jgi:glycosyltransferase involved in cell wall biosynthesis
VAAPKQANGSFAFVTNYCPHYREKTFEVLARDADVDYYFYSDGGEWYWQKEHSVRSGRFKHVYLPGFRLGRTRFAPTLPWKLWRGGYDAYIKCINGRFALPATYLVARLRRRPFILWTGIWTRIQTAPHRIFFWLTRYIYRHADAIVVYGEHVKRYLMLEGVPEERIFVAPHAVDNEQYNYAVAESERAVLRARLNIGDDQKVVLYLGRLEDGKGLSYLVEAFASLPHDDTVLLLVGTGSERPRLEQLIRSHGLEDRVRFAGYVPAEQTVPYYAIAWVLVLPSVTTPTFKEPWGLVVNEAMNQGVPVIATNAVGAAAGALVRHGVNGLVVPERDSAALARAIQEILGDPERRERMAERARTIIAGWDNERMVSGFRQAIESVLAFHEGKLR